MHWLAKRSGNGKLMTAPNRLNFAPQTMSLSHFLPFHHNSIRDQLHSKYKSSTKAKKQRRKELEKKKKKEPGSITPPEEIESRFDPFALVTFEDDGLRKPNKAASNSDELALMLAPIGESFATGIEAL